MQTYKYVILGGGLVAGYAAEKFVAEGIYENELCIISDEQHPPYDRPPLSKGFLAGEKSVADTLINDAEFYAENGIELKLNSRVDRVDFDARRLHIAETDETIGFEKLLIATGAGVRELDLPGVELENIFYLRKLGDAKAIRQAAADAKKAVVVGGSFIGMETTAVLQEVGVDTTMLFPESRVWEAFFTPEMSAFFTDYYEKRGVNILPDTGLTCFNGEEGRVTAVVTDTGAQIPTDLVIMGVGVTPNTDLFRETALQVDDGVIVNRFLETNVPDVYAAGDVARYRDVLYDKLRRVEHWDNAYAQGKHAACAMLGQRERFEHIPYFFSDEFDLSYEFWGDTVDAEEVVYRGDVTTDSFSVWWLQEKQLRAAFVMNRPDEEREAAQEWITSGEEIDPEWLAAVDTLGEAVPA